MDLLQQKTLDLFDFEPEDTIVDIVSTWKERDLWYYTIIKNERTSFSLKTDKGDLITEKNGDVKYFTTKDNALQYATQSRLSSVEVIEEVETFYTAKSKFDRLIMSPFGGVIEFSSENKALRVARHYNDDIVKMELAAGEYLVK